MATATDTSPKPGILINRNYGFLWFGQAISLIGDEVFDLTLVVWIAGVIARQPNGAIQPWAPLAVSGVLIASTIPYFLVGPLAGVFVDRWNKRTTMLRMDAARALLIASLLLVSGIVPLPFFAGGKPPLALQLGMIYSVVFLASICAQFFNPARLALIGDVVEDRYRAQASGLGQGTQSLAIIIGPPLAAPLLFSFGVEWALIINALSFVVSFACISFVQAPPAAQSVAAGEQGNVGREFRAGLRFALTNRVVSTIVVLAFIAQLGVGCFNALNVFFITQNLHAPVTALGYLGGIFGVGAIAGAVISGFISQRVGIERMLVSSIILLGIVFLALTRMTQFLPALVLVFLMGIVQMCLNVTIGPLVLRNTPREMVGRVIAVITPTSMGAQLLSIGLAGYLASSVLAGFHAHALGLQFGPIDTIFSGGALLMVSAGIYAGLRLRSAAPPPPAPDVAPVAAASADVQVRE